MYCIKCGKEIEEGKMICDECAQEQEVEVVEVIEVIEEKEQTEQISNGKTLGFGIASLACGVYGLSFLIIPFFALAFGIVAVVLSKKSLNTKWHKFAKAGHITGKIAIIISSILMGLLIALLCFYLFAGFFYWLIAVIALMFKL